MQVDHDIQVLEAAIAQIVERQQQLQHTYLQAIAPALKRRLFQAIFHFCTQRSPKEFLSLSSPDRLNLQRELQEIGAQATESLCSRPVASTGDIDEALAEVLELSLKKSRELLNRYQIAAHDQQIQLKPIEIETGDRALMSLRGELRVLSARHAQKLEQLRQKQWLKVVATAEDAWHTSWVTPSN